MSKAWSHMFLNLHHNLFQTKEDGCAWLTKMAANLNVFETSKKDAKLIFFHRSSLGGRVIFVWPWKRDSLCVCKLFHLPIVFELRTHFPRRIHDVAPNMEMALFGRPIKKSLKRITFAESKKWSKAQMKRRWMRTFELYVWFLVVFRIQSLII